MEGQNGLHKLFFEFASESRLGILRELQVRELKMQELARTLDLTDTEICRQLKRLTEALMISKQPDGKYNLTNYGHLALQFFPPLEFILNYREYFLEHDFWVLPYSFINRLGELSGGEFYREAMSTLNRARKSVFEAKETLWVMAEQVDSSHVAVTSEKMSEGLKFKFIMPPDLAAMGGIYPEMLLCPHCKEALLKDAKGFVDRTCNFCEKRLIDRIQLSMLITEKESSVFLRRLDGQMDYIGFVGTDEKFRKWTQDLFMYYWERAERWYPNFQIKK